MDMACKLITFTFCAHVGMSGHKISIANNPENAAVKCSYRGSLCSIMSQRGLMGNQHALRLAASESPSTHKLLVVPILRSC